MSKKKLYDEGSMASFVVMGFENIKKLSESGLISEKLVGLNTIMFVLISAILMLFSFNGTQDLFSLSAFILFLFALAIGFIISLIYAPLLNAIANFSKDKVESLRAGLIVLFLDLPIATAAIVFHVLVLVKIAAIAVGIQIALVLLGAVWDFSKGISQDIETTPSELWQVLNKISIICGIVGFIISVLMIAIGK